MSNFRNHHKQDIPLPCSLSPHDLRTEIFNFTSNWSDALSRRVKCRYHNRYYLICDPVNSADRWIFTFQLSVDSIEIVSFILVRKVVTSNLFWLFWIVWDDRDDDIAGVKIEVSEWSTMKLPMKLLQKHFSSSLIYFQKRTKFENPVRFLISATSVYFHDMNMYQRISSL